MKKYGSVVLGQIIELQSKKNSIKTVDFHERKMEIDNDSCDEKATIDKGAFNHPALNIPEIRQHIFSFLPLDSIKTCRLVSCEWNASAEPFLLKRSHIMFRNDRLFPEEARLPDRFLDDIRNSSLLNKFDKFYFSSPEYSIDFEDIEDFIESFGSNVKELFIFRLNIHGLLRKVSHEELMKLIPMNLTKLDVVCANVQTKLVIPMDRLKNISTLRIGEGILKIVKNVEPAPAELQLKNAFFLNDRKYEAVRINNLFDFRNLQILRLDCSDTRNMELDLSGDLNLKTLILERVKILNWESSNWTAKKLFLGDKMKFIKATGLKFDQLHYGGQMIDIAVLPKTLKSLSLKRTQIRNIEFAQNLTDLQCLALHRRKFGILTYFQNCPKLTNLHLIPYDESSVIDLGCITTKSLKVFRLTGDCELMGTADVQIDTVMVEHIEFVKSFHIASNYLKTKNFFVFTFDFESLTKDLIVVYMKGLFEKYFIGPFFQKEEDKYRFSTSLDIQKAQYLIKKNDDAVLTKEIGPIEVDRIRDDWWINNL